MGFNTFEVSRAFPEFSPPQYGWGRLFFQNLFRRGPLRPGHGIPSSTGGISDFGKPDAGDEDAITTAKLGTPTSHRPKFSKIWPFFDSFLRNLGEGWEWGSEFRSYMHFTLPQKESGKRSLAKSDEKSDKKVTEKWPKESRKQEIKVSELLLPTSFSGSIRTLVLREPVTGIAREMGVGALHVGGGVFGARIAASRLPLIFHCFVSGKKNIEGKPPKKLRNSPSEPGNNSEKARRQ